jgi:hypothetical protein
MLTGFLAWDPTQPVSALRLKGYRHSESIKSGEYIIEQRLSGVQSMGTAHLLEPGQDRSISGPTIMF